MPVLDQDQDQNQGVGIAVGAERRFRTRYNSDVESRLANVTIPDLLVPNIRAGSAPHNPNNRTYPDFHTLWNADLQACSYLDDFLAVFGGETQPIMTHLIDAGKLTLEDVQDAERHLREISKKGRRS